MKAVTRNTYGELIATAETATLIEGARKMASHAASRGRIPAAFDGMAWERVSARIGRKMIGEAMHHEVYDVTPDGRRALICCRAAEGTKYGVKTVSKEYFILARHGAGVRVMVANKATAAKAAKSTGELGQAIDVAEGKAKLVTMAVQKRIGYKLVARNEDGELVSVWDGSPWSLGVTRTEKATDDHEGGFYYYRTAEEALSAAAKSEVFGQHRDHNGLVLVEVEACGREYGHPGGKLCVTSMRPVRIVE